MYTRTRHTVVGHSRWGRTKGVGRSRRPLYYFARKPLSAVAADAIGSWCSTTISYYGMLFSSGSVDVCNSSTWHVDLARCTDLLKETAT